MAENKDIYRLGQSVTGSIVDIGEEIRIDLQLEDNVLQDVGTVYGECKDEQDIAIEGCTIKVTDTNYNPKYHTITDENGSYTIDNITSNKQYLILAIKDGYTLTQGTPFVMQTSQQILRNFTLPEDTGATNGLVAGDIADDEGQKLEGVKVTLYDNTDPENPIIIKSTHTNQFGQYTFFDVTQGLYLVSATILGYKTATTTFVISQDSQIINVNLAMILDPTTRLGTINGIIKDKNNQPVANAYVILYRETDDGSGNKVLTAIRRTTTNSSGLYMFEQVPQGDYKIKSNKINAV